MDSSLQSTHSIENDREMSLENQQEIGDHEDGTEHSIHLPNPSGWPILLGVAVLLTFIGLLFINTTPLIVLVAVVLVFVGIMGWALEDPMAKIKEKFVTAFNSHVDHSPYKIGQNVIDKKGEWIGKVQARFPNYLLAEQSGFIPKVYYVPRGAIEQDMKNNAIVLSLSESDLLEQGLNSIPSDLYDEQPEYGAPKVRGVPLFANQPLSPAETGHYNYGRNSPGINTDASGSYYRDEVQPRPQRFVGELNERRPGRTPSSQRAT